MQLVGERWINELLKYDVFFLKDSGKVAENHCSV